MKISGRAQLAVHPDFQAATRDAAERFASAAEKAVRAKGLFSAALSGAATPQPLHRLLASDFRDRIDWGKTHLFFGDERCVPPDDPESNFKAARENLISRVPIPATNVHRMPAERGDLAAAAAEYEAEIRSVLGGEIPAFDLVQLGVGDDGHTASLFPGSPALQEKKRLVVGNYSERLKSWRMTFTLPLINRAACALFLVEGKSKSEAVKRSLEDGGDPVPAGLVRPESGELVWILDRDAAARIAI
jgi:6-phosphogluconolactonase